MQKISSMCISFLMNWIYFTFIVDGEKCVLHMFWNISQFCINMYICVLLLNLKKNKRALLEPEVKQIATISVKNAQFDLEMFRFL